MTVRQYKCKGSSNFIFSSPFFTEGNIIYAIQWDEKEETLNEIRQWTDVEYVDPELFIETDNGFIFLKPFNYVVRSDYFAETESDNAVFVFLKEVLEEAYIEIK